MAQEGDFVMHRCEGCGSAVPCVVECACITCRKFGPIPGSPWCSVHKRHALPLLLPRFSLARLRKMDPAKVQEWLCSGADGKPKTAADFHPVPVHAGPATGVARDTHPGPRAVFHLALAAYAKFERGTKSVEARDISDPRREKTWSHVRTGQGATLTSAYRRPHLHAVVGRIVDAPTLAQAPEWVRTGMDHDPGRPITDVQRKPHRYFEMLDVHRADAAPRAVA